MQDHDPDPVDGEARQGRPREAQQWSVDPRRVLQRAEVGGGVPRLVDRGDLDLLDRHPQLAGPQQSRQLVLVAVAGDLQQPVQSAGRVAAQTGLGIAQPPPGGPAEQQCGGAVPEPTAQGHRPGEGPHPQRHMAGLADPVGHRGDVGGRVLAIGVGAYDVGVRPQVRGPRQAGAQSRPLARVDRIAGDHGPGVAGRGEHLLVGRTGAVVDDEHLRAGQPPPDVGHQRGQAGVRLVGGHEHHQPGGPEAPGLGRVAGALSALSRHRGCPAGRARHVVVAAGVDSTADRHGSCLHAHVRLPGRCRGCRRWRARHRWRAD